MAKKYDKRDQRQPQRQRPMDSSEMVERVPPQDLEAEISVLGSMLVSPEQSFIVDQLEPDDFYRAAHGIIFESIKELVRRGDPVDLITVSSSLRNKGYIEDVGGYGYLMDMASSIPTAVNAGYYAGLVKNAATLRNAIYASAEIMEAAYGEIENIPQFLDEAEQKIFALGHAVGNRNHPTPIADVMKSVMDIVETRYEKQDVVSGYSTGFYDLDYMTSGLQPSDLIILAARPAMGKTSWALNLAQNVANNTKLPVIIHSLEMSKEQLGQRMACSEGKIDSHRLKTGYLTEGDWPRLAEAVGFTSSLPIFIDDTPAITAMEIRSKARRIMTKANKPLGLIVIDYLQLMSGGGNGGDGNRVQEISAISRALKSLARELNVPIIALSQLSRGVESRTDKRPMLSDLRESGSIEQDADIVMFIYRDDYYNPDTTEKNIAEIIIAKHRNGPVGKVRLFFENQHTRFENLTEDPNRQQA